MTFSKGPRPTFPPPPPPYPDPIPRPPPGHRGFFFALASAFLSACSSPLALQRKPLTPPRGILWQEYSNMGRNPSTRPPLPDDHPTCSLNVNKRPSIHPPPSDIQDGPCVPVKYNMNKKSSIHPPPSDAQDGPRVPANSSMSKRPSTNPPPPDIQDGPSLPVNSSLEFSDYYRNTFDSLPKGMKGMSRSLACSFVPLRMS